jgi:rhamnose transport system permease protein
VKKAPLRRLFRWETMLVCVLIAICAVFNQRDSDMQAMGLFKRDVFNLASVISAMRPYMLYSFMTLGMMLILAMGDIDISTGASAALSVAALGVSYQAMTGSGLPSGAALASAITICLVTGSLCGFINGMLATRFKELFPMIITLSTQLFFRGISFLLLGGGTLTFKNDATFDLLKRLYATVPLAGINLPVIIIWFLLAAAVYCVWMHFTPSGRRIFAIGANARAAFISGVRVDRIKLFAFTLCGLMAALTGVFFIGATSSSIRADSMMGYELYAIAAAVLGGFSTSGGKGSVPGAVISLAIFGVMKIGLATLYGFADSMVNLSVGLILILSALMPNALAKAGGWLRLNRSRSALNP